MVFHPLIEDVRAHLALHERKGAGAHDLLAVQLLAPGIPAGLALDHQVGVGGDQLHKLRRHLVQAEHYLVVVNDLHARFDFPGHRLDGIRPRYPHEGTPVAGSALHGLRLGKEKHRSDAHPWP